MALRVSSIDEERARIKSTINLAWNDYNQAEEGSAERIEALKRAHELTSRLDSLNQTPHPIFLE